MKVLLVGQFFPPINGCSLANETLLRNLIQLDIKYDKINTSTPKLDSNGLGKVSFNKIFRFAILYISLFKIIRSSVVYTTPGQTFLGIVKYAPFYLLAMLLNKPYIIHVHGNYLGEQYKILTGFKRKIFHFLVSRSAIGIVLSKGLISNFDGLLPKHKIRIVENFAQDELLDESLVKKTDQLRILFMSNLMKEKGVLDLLDALEELKINKVSFKALFAGKVEAGLENDVKKRLEQLGSNVEYIGVVSGNDKLRAFQDANVFCLPTYYNQEGQPISILEAMATKNIILTTRHAGIPDICSSDSTFFCNKNSKEDIALNLVHISKELPQLITKIGESNFREMVQ